MADGALAIIGLACRLPGAADYTQFWEVLEERRSCVVPVPAERWDADLYYSADPEAPDRMISKWGGFVADADHFDAEFFGVSAREARIMDPQQRLILELAWSCIEDAGYAPTALSGRSIGVFVGVYSGEYRDLQTRSGRMSGHTITGNSTAFTTSRVSQFLNLHGPSIPVDTACSSSLVALHQAMSAIRSGECEQALVGGVNLMLNPDITIGMSGLGMLSPTGQCHTFDASADGFVRGEGAGMLLVKPLERAVLDGDPIRAVILGSAVNHTGHTRTTTSPSVFSQSGVIYAAFRRAGVDPATVSYIETHGTGTPLGDPIEINALKRAFRKLSGASATPPVACGLGAVKTNVGHLEAAAGIAGLIKLVLSLERGRLPGLANFQRLNPRIDFKDSPFYLVTESIAWPELGSSDGTRLPRRAGVSSFGFSGVNSHVVLEEAPTRVIEAGAAPRPWHIFTVSARTEPALLALTRRHSEFLAAHPNTALEDACLTANVARVPMKHRVAVVAATTEGLSSNLAVVTSSITHSGTFRGAASATAPKVAFLFTGQGSQYPGMSRELYETQPVFREALDRCDAGLRAHLSRPLLEVLFGTAAAAAELDQTAFTQPALFAVEYALACLWRSFGITPAAMLGHSVGEYVAACLAGVFTLQDGLKLIAMRGRLMQALPRDGAMAVVMAPLERVEAAIDAQQNDLAIAAINGPANIVISGRAAAVERIGESLRAAGIRVTPLSVSHAFHSPLLEPMLEEFERAAAGVSYNAPSIPIISNVTGTLAGPEIATPAYWRRHAREPVLFADGMANLRGLGCDSFIEIGPQPVLIGMSRATGIDESAAWCPSLRKGASEWGTLLGSVGQLFVRGAAIDWSNVHRNAGGRRIALPTYVFQGARHWSIGPISAVVPPLVPAASVPGEPGIAVVGAPAASASQQPEAPDFRSELDHCPAGRRFELLLDYVRGELARVMAIEDSRGIDAETDLMLLGLDSLTAVELRNRLQRSLRIELPLVVVFERPTLAALIGFMLQQCTPAQDREETVL